MAADKDHWPYREVIVTPASETPDHGAIGANDYVYPYCNTHREWLDGQLVASETDVDQAVWHRQYFPYRGKREDNPQHYPDWELSGYIWGITSYRQRLAELGEIWKDATDGSDWSLRDGTSDYLIFTAPTTTKLKLVCSLIIAINKRDSEGRLSGISAHADWYMPNGGKQTGKWGCSRDDSKELKTMMNFYRKIEAAREQWRSVQRFAALVERGIINQPYSWFTKK